MKEKKVTNRSISYQPGASFALIQESKLLNSLHCHSAYELILIEEGHGKEYIGDSVREYSAGDVVLLGKNLPHLYLPDNPKQNKCRVLQFPEKIFPACISEVDEFRYIRSLLTASERGLCFSSKDIFKSMSRKLDKLGHSGSIFRITAVYTLLDFLGRKSGYTVLSASHYRNPMDSYLPDDPVSRIQAYLINNHKDEITLDAIAKSVKLNAASLCRMFKQRTGKTIFGMLSEIRIEYSCKLLATTDLTILQIAMESGFGNQAHFNKQFHKITGHTPSEYRRIIKL